MNTHLSPDERLAALDATLDPARAAHMEVCEACRTDLAELGAALALVGADAVPEPSPLFWDHFSSRVREATEHEPPVLTVWPWARAGRSWLVAGAAVAAIVVVIFLLRPALVPPGSSAIDVARTSGNEVAVQEEPWAFVVETSEGMSLDEVHAFVSASGDAAPLVEELSMDERAAFVRLVRAEMETNQ